MSEVAALVARSSLASVMPKRLGMKNRNDRRQSERESRRKAHHPAPMRRTVTRPGDMRRVRTSLVPHVVTFGILAFGTTAFAGGAKGIVYPPPTGPLVPIYLLLAVSFFVVGACMWFVGSVFTDRRFTNADPRTQVKLAREALAPILEILGLLHKTAVKPAPAS